MISSVRPAPVVGGCTADTKECDFEKWGGDNVRPECCTAHLVELTFFIADLLERHGITYWLDYGTLLGAVRGGELIPWDADADLSVMVDDLERILALEPEVAVAGHRLQLRDRFVRVSYSAVNEVHLDLFLWAREGDRMQPVRDFDEWPGNAGRSSFPSAYLDEPERLALHGRELPAPSPVDRFLVEHRYGPDYLTPRRQPWFQVYPNLSEEELTPGARELVDRIATADGRLLELLHRPGRSRAAWLWSVSGLPLRPDGGRVEALRSGREARPSPALDHLYGSMALLEQSIDELEHPRKSLVARRLGRRAVRAAAFGAAWILRRPHHAGFPFGIES
jgi:LicD family